MLTYADLLSKQASTTPPGTSNLKPGVTGAMSMPGMPVGGAMSAPLPLVRGPGMKQKIEKKKELDADTLHV